MNKIYLIFLLAALLVISSCGNNTNTQVVQDNSNQNSVNLGKNTIEITSSGFSPKELTIKQGDTVTWLSKDGDGHWPASAVHPTHEKYPGSSITKCGTAEQSSIFDSCHGLNNGESWSFKFTQKGTWFYHDHSHPKLFGKITVQ